jgi:hypothetical protein
VTEATHGEAIGVEAATAGLVTAEALNLTAVRAGRSCPQNGSTDHVAAAPLLSAPGPRRDRWGRWGLSELRPRHPRAAPPGTPGRRTGGPSADWAATRRWSRVRTDFFQAVK